MSLYRRIFSSMLMCGLLFGTVFLIRFQLSKFHKNKDLPVPEFLPNVDRYRASRVCSPRAMVLINSAPGHTQRRQIIRQTWAHPQITESLDVSVAFGVGKANSSDVQRILDWEAEMFGDMFQKAGEDMNENSAGVIEFLKSTRSACDHSPDFILKMEDQIFLNPFRFDELLQNLEKFSSSNTLWCIDWKKHLDTPHSNLSWIVPSSYLDNSVHPSHCLAAVYLMTSRALDAIIRQHDVQPLTSSILLPEDVYITSMLANKAGVILSSLGERVPFDLMKEEIVDAGQLIFAFLRDDVDEVTEQLWKLLEDFKVTRRYDLGF